MITHGQTVAPLRSWEVGIGVRENSEARPNSEAQRCAQTGVVHRTVQHPRNVVPPRRRTLSLEQLLGQRELTAGLNLNG